MAPAVHAATTETDRLYEQGKAALDEGDHDGALAHFKEALQRAGTDEGTAWQMMLAIAVTYRAKGEVGYAIEYYRRFLARSDRHRAVLTKKWLKRRSLVEADIGSQEAEAGRTHGFVSITTEPDGAKIFIDDRRAGADSDALAPHGAFLKPGAHRIRVELEGFVAVEAEVTAAAGKLQPLTLRLEAVPVEAAPLAAPEPAAPVAAAPEPDVAIAAVHVPAEGEGSLGPWLLIGGASAAAVASVVLTVLGEAKNGKLNRLGKETSGWNAETYAQTGAQWRTTESERDTLRAASGALYAVAGAAVAGGVLWIVLGGGSEESAASATPSVDLTPTSGGAYGQATWRF